MAQSRVNHHLSKYPKLSRHLTSLKIPDQMTLPPASLRMDWKFYSCTWPFLSHLGVCVGKWGAVVSEMSVDYWVSALPFTLWLWWQWTANRAQAEAKSKRWWGRKASRNRVPFSEGGVIRRKDTLFQVKILWNSEHTQGGYRSSVIRYHPELDGGQTNTGTRQQGQHVLKSPECPQHLHLVQKMGVETISWRWEC